MCLRTEEPVSDTLRMLLGLCIHDCELAKLHQHEPILRQSVDSLPQISSDELFAVRDAKAWKTLFVQERMGTSSHITQDHPDLNSVSAHPPHLSSFQLYAELESISAVAQEGCRSVASWSNTAQKCQGLLTRWYEMHDLSRGQSKHDMHCLMILWHSSFMNLLSDFDALEIACGRDGDDAASKYLPYTQSWTLSADGRRCLVHAALILRHFRSLQVGVEPAIHVPMALYRCGLAWVCWIRFRGDREPEAADLSLPALHLPHVYRDKLAVDIADSLQGERSESSLLFKVIDCLQQISHWKVAQSFASTLLAILDETREFL